MVLGGTGDYGFRVGNRVSNMAAVMALMQEITVDTTGLVNRYIILMIRSSDNDACYPPVRTRYAIF